MRGWSALVWSSATVVALVGAPGCGGGSPASRAESVWTGGPEDRPIAQSDVSTEGGGWRITRTTAGSVRLFEVTNPDVEQAVLLYRAEMKATNVTGRAYLEMWVRIPGRGEFFSRGLDQALSGTTDWASYETPFVLQEGQRPDLLKLNVAFEGGGGTVWLRDPEVLRTSLR